jgi:hypothetical protein
MGRAMRVRAMRWRRAMRGMRRALRGRRRSRIYADDVALLSAGQTSTT